MSLVSLPQMRTAVIDAVSSLADPQVQKRWGVYDPETNEYDDFTTNVGILYDDTDVLPDPSRAVGTVLLPSEVDDLTALARVLDPILEDLGDVADDIYLDDARWPAVIAAAKAALDCLHQTSPPAT